MVDKTLFILNSPKVKKFQIPKSSKQIHSVTQSLPSADNGYFDILVAVGYAALADSFYMGSSPVIKKTFNGFEITHSNELRPRPNLSWLKYSLAASWKKEENFQNASIVKKDKTWHNTEIIEHEGAVVDTSEDLKILLEMGKEIKPVTAPLRELYGVINKLGSPKWFNACIYTCRKKGKELLIDTFSGKTSFNKIILPQSSKGAMSDNSFSIGNRSIMPKYSKKWEREIYLAVAGLIACSRGSLNNGFAIPAPSEISYSFLRHLVSRNRRRIIPKDFFFPYNNYMYYLKMLKAYGDSGQKMLFAVQGANFIELGTQSSPAGTWLLRVPEYKFSLNSILDLDALLFSWRKALKPKPTSPPNVNRLAVRKLMNGFESGDIESFVEGYLLYIDTVGLNGTKKPYFLNNQQFYEIMKNNSQKYHELVEAMRGPEIKPIISLIKQDTFHKVFKKDENRSEQPDYQMIRKLREVQNHEDLVTVICEIAIKRSIDKMTSKNTQNDSRKPHNLPTQEGITKIIQISEDPRYSPRLVAQLLLAFALSKASSNE